MNINYFDLYYTVIKAGVDNKIVDDQYENNENDYVIFNDFITPNHYIGIKPRETILKYVEKYEILNRSFQVILPI